jgi:Periplasmic binding protein/Nucleotidyl transferase AbiEii toxin, Type IV TA system
MAKQMRDIGASVRARLLALARHRNQQFDLVLTRYALERLLYRLSLTAHRERFVLKGAMLITTWFDEPHRPTRDVDLLGYGDRSPEPMLTVFQEICAITAADGLTFDTNALRVDLIREELQYGGLRLRTTAALAGARISVVTESFYWDLNDKSRAWSKRYIEKFGKPANMLQAGNYGAVAHYLKAVQAIGTTNGTEVVKQMKKTPINDFMTQDGRIREDGRVMRPMYLFQVKSPMESKYKFDDYKLIATFPGEKVFRSLAESECPLVKK